MTSKDATGPTGPTGPTGTTPTATATTSASCVVRLSFLQIYNEKIFDLLNPSITVSQREVGGRGDEFSGLRLRWDAAKRHFFVENLFQYECSSAEEALQYYQQGIQNKQVLGEKRIRNPNSSKLEARFNICLIVFGFHLADHHSGLSLIVQFKIQILYPRLFPSNDRWHPPQ